MRLWSLQHKYLDAQGLVALWREALLAKAVLRNATKGYRNHPQLERFRASSTPLLAINSFLAGVFVESIARGYTFNHDKVGPVRAAPARHYRPNRLRMVTFARQAFQTQSGYFC